MQETQDTQVQSLGREDNPLQYSCQENRMDRGAWPAPVHRVAKSTEVTCHTYVHQHFFFSGLGFCCCRAFLYLNERGLLSSCGSRVSHCGDFSCCRVRALRHVDCSRWGSQALAHRLSSCGAQPQLLQGLWDLPRSRTEPISPVLAGRFFTTEPPRKPLY